MRTGKYLKIPFKKYSDMLKKIIELKIPIKAGSGCMVNYITIDSYGKVSEAMKFICF